MIATVATSRRRTLTDELRTDLALIREALKVPLPRDVRVKLMLRERTLSRRVGA